MTRHRLTTKHAWSIVTKARNGIVSVVRDLTLDEVRHTYECLDPEYGHTYIMREYPNGSSSGLGPENHDGDIILREVFGPPGWNRSEMESWGKEWPKEQIIKVDARGIPLHEDAA